MSTVRPPDDWGDDDYAPTPQQRPSGPSDRPTLDSKSEALRTAWVEAFRAFVEHRDGGRSTYNSNVQWDGGRQRTNTKKGYRDVQPVWPKIVERATQAGIDHPEDLVRTLFSRWTSDSAPVPWALVSDQNIASARGRRSAVSAHVALSLRAEEGVFRMALWSQSQSIPDPRGAASFVLNDTGRELSPLFRYSVAVLRDLPAVAQRWRAAAVNQLLQDPAPYLELWAGILPVDLQEAATAAARTGT